ncbi:MAG: hypothetical protein NUV77_19805, partial [Thermoguttaceae bacterium]|nr:hypothetical protein [Thermoguttaceae bacterium]
MSIALWVLGISGEIVLAQPPEQSVVIALDELDRWLDTSPEGAGWRVYLESAKLRSQLALGTNANPEVVFEVLGRYAGDVPGLELPPFVEVRNALASWLAALPASPVDRLAAATRSAKSVFLVRTPSDLYRARLELGAAVERLEARLQGAGPEADGWRKYLKFEDLKNQLALPTPDLAVLDAIHVRFAAGYDGLGLVWFADVRQGLRRYLTTARLVGDAKLRGQYEQVLETLGQRLEAYRKAPGPEDAAGISAALGWLRDAGQAPWLVAAVQSQCSHPNLFLSVSDRLVAARLSRAVDDVSPVQDCILGTALYGTAHTVGRIEGRLVPSDEAGIVDLLFEGTSATENVGYHGPATIYSSGTTGIGARKRLFLNADGVSSLPTVSEAVTSSTIHGIDTGGRAMVERIAWKRAMRQKSLAEAIASEHAEARFNRRMDDEAEPLAARANDGFQKRFRQPLEDRKLFPESFRAVTTAQSLTLSLLTLGETGLGAPTAPPEVAGVADLTLRAHESSLNNLTAQALAGVVLDEKRFDEIAARYLALPARAGEGKDEENWSITFAPRQPVTVQFADGGFSVTIRGARYMNQGRDYPAMNVAARYRIEKTPQGFRAVRQGALEVYPPRAAPGSG